MAHNFCFPPILAGRELSQMEHHQMHGTSGVDPKRSFWKSRFLQRANESFHAVFIPKRWFFDLFDCGVWIDVLNGADFFLRFL